MSVTLDTSHDPIGPFGPCAQLPTGELSMHASTAVLSSARDCGVNIAAAVEGTSVTLGLACGSAGEHDHGSERYSVGLNETYCIIITETNSSALIVIHGSRMTDKRV